MKARPNWPLFVGLAAAVVVVDQLTKAWIAATIVPGAAQSIIGENLRLVNSHNSGALFGLFRENALLFGIVSLGVIGFIVAYHARSARSAYMSVTLGLLLGGAIGNVTDRLRLGYVVDFVDAGIGDLRWYTFNVADAAISFAIILLILVAVRPTFAEAPKAAVGPGGDA